MREAFCGAFMIKLVLALIVIYISLMSVAIIYARAFRVKNQVINYIEQYQYMGEANSEAEEKIEKYLLEVGYPTNLEGVAEDCEQQNGELMSGVCIIANESGNNSRYYKVITYIHIDLRLFDLNLIIPVSGETKVIR